jgi:hypothetical protein
LHCLEPISGRDAQVHETVSGMQYIQFAQRRREDLTGELGSTVGGIAVVKIFGRLIAKTDDHRLLLLYRDYMLAVLSCNIDKHTALRSGSRELVHGGHARSDPKGTIQMCPKQYGGYPIILYTLDA